MANSRKAAPALLLATLAAGFAWAAARLLGQRLETGDVYPASSSLRADPAGSRALYEALRELNGRGVRRNFEPIDRLQAGPRTAVLLLGTQGWILEEAGRAEAERLESAVRSGTRLVIALSPAPSFRRRPELTVTPPPGTPTEKKGAGARPGRPTRRETDDDVGEVSLPNRWGFSLEAGDALDQPQPARLAAVEGAAGLPTAVPWRTGASFGKLHPAWRSVYVLGSKPVLIERPFGRGAIVLATDSAFAANATLKTARQPTLLLWLVGNRPEIVFDETHFGMGERSGLAALARRYRLHGLLAGLFLLAFLFVWKSAVVFAPAAGPPEAETAVTGRRAAEGLAAVLRRHVAPKDLSRACFVEWKKAFARSRPALARELSRTARDEDPVAAYRRARALAKEKRLP